MTHAERAREAAAYLREEADFNRSWTDGRRSMAGATPAYISRRLELAEQREQWAASIEALALLAGNPAYIVSLPEGYIVLASE